MQFIAIDSGRNGVKCVSDSKKAYFKSRIGEWRQRVLTSGGDYEVTINGKKYFVSDLADESHFEREMATESKIHEETKVLLLTGLALVANPGEPMVLTTSLPIDQHDDNTKAAFQEFLEGVYKVGVQGDCVNIPDRLYRIDKVLITIEGGAAIWDEVLNAAGDIKDPWWLDKTVRGADIGAKTVNYFTLKNMRYIDRDSGTLPYGTIQIQNSDLDGSEEGNAQFARKVIGGVSKKFLDFNLKREIPFFTGGGALMLQNGRHLEKAFPTVRIATDPLFATASGSRKLAIRKWHKTTA